MNFDSYLKLNEETISSPNLCNQFSEEDLQRIGEWAFDNYKRDLQSRERWLQRMESGMDLAMQLSKPKNNPWPGCSNVAFPLITIAAMQFHSRAYPAIVDGRNVVKCQVVGGDQSGELAARAVLIGKHMSWQRLEQDQSWEEDLDRGLLNLAITGSIFKKSYYDHSLGYPVSELVLAKDLVVNYHAKSIESARVKTHVIPLYRNDLHEGMKRGRYRDVSNDGWYTSTPAPREGWEREDSRAGMEAGADDPNTPFTCLEQHCWLDLDCDGYEEPYIVLLEESSQTVLRIVCRFDRIEDVEFNKKREVVSITPTEYFTKIPFVPSPDGGIYDIGFGIFLGPLNESVNSAINQLFDAGTLANTAGGFLGRGAKIKGGVYRFEPFSWHRVDSTGDDLRKSIYPLPTREPSAVLYNLLTLLIDYTNRVAGATDLMVGKTPGQNTPAETTQAMLEQGQKIYSAIFKRVWVGMKKEFQKIYTLNAIYLPARLPFGDGLEVRREDYSVSVAAVRPAADPNVTSDGLRMAQATLVREAAAGAAGYDADEVERRYLRAAGVDDVDKVFLGSDKTEAPVDVKIQIQQMKMQIEAAKLEQQKMEFILTMQNNARLDSAKILQLEAQAKKLEAEAESEPGRRNVEAFRAGIEAMRERNNHMNAQLDRMMEQVNGRNTGSDAGGIQGGIFGVEESPGNAEIT